MGLYQNFLIIIFFLTLLVSLVLSFDIANIPVQETEPLSFLSVYQNGTIVDVFDLRDLNRSFFEEGVHAISLEKKFSTEFYFISNEEILQKVDEVLLNETFLKEEGYLNEEEEVPVIISLDTETKDENSEQNFGITQITQDIETSKKQKFEEAKSEVNQILAETEGNEETREDLEIVNSIAATVPLDKIKDIASSEKVKKVYLDWKV